jgi:hypothetical protein
MISIIPKLLLWFFKFINKFFKKNYIISCIIKNNRIYSVDLAIKYFDNFKSKQINKVHISIISEKSRIGWYGDDDIFYYAKDILANPEINKFHFDKIIKADLKYPILLFEDGSIFDGYHRIAKKMYIETSCQFIKTITINNNLLKKFYICTDFNWETNFLKKINKIIGSDTIETDYDKLIDILFIKRFIE